MSHLLSSRLPLELQKKFVALLSSPAEQLQVLSAAVLRETLPLSGQEVNYIRENIGQLNSHAAGLLLSQVQNWKCLVQPTSLFWDTSFTTSFLQDICVLFEGQSDLWIFGHCYCNFKYILFDNTVAACFVFIFKGIIECKPVSHFKPWQAGSKADLSSLCTQLLRNLESRPSEGPTHSHMYTLPILNNILTHSPECLNEGNGQSSCINELLCLDSYQKFY